MRIAYTCHDSFPSPATNTQQTFWTLLEVARFGLLVDLIIPSVAADAADPRTVLADYYGLSPDTLPDALSITPRGPRPLLTALQKGRFDWGVGRYLRSQIGSHDFVWTRDPVAALACTRERLPTLFETYRLDYASRSAFWLWRKQCLASPALVGVVAHSKVTADAFLHSGVPPDRVLVAYNGFAPSLLEPRLTRAEARARLSLPAGPLAVYAGHTGPEKGVDVLIPLAAAVPSAHMVVLGASEHSTDGRRLRELARRAGARNLVLRPRVPLQDVSAYLYAADCLVIPPTDEPLRTFRHTVLPMKVFMYLAAGRPIFAPRLPDLEEVIRDGETARLVSPLDARQAAEGFAALLSDSVLQDRLSRNALAASTRYTWSARAQRIVDFLNVRR
jgi:glycosyltransferase involved in cell wall biosynthesis